MVLLVILIVLAFIVYTINVSKVEKRNERKTHLYLHEECPNYFGPHGDTLKSIFIKQTHDKSEVLIDSSKPEWKVLDRTKSNPEGSCLEYITIKETRNNQSKWEYHICWINEFKWLLQFDLPRILTDKTYFNKILLKAESGDSDAQTLIGSCYAHCLELAKPVITKDEQKALYWWNKAAEQGHRYAMTELAIYYFNKKSYKEAVEWNNKGQCHVYTIDNYERTLINNNSMKTRTI
ncbi:MAG: sel1 repeat family protein [Bacteroidales bacterium]|nr:sel1 repeat family protein [Bacteroidales bacterium]